MKKWEKKAIEEIMNEFDFERVHDVMDFLDWDWGFMGVPSVDIIKKEAKRLMQDLCNGSSGYIATGGFWVYIHRKEHILNLMFAVEDWYYE